jgi:hypothetical protein
LILNAVIGQIESIILTPLYDNLYEELKKQMPEYAFKYLDLPDYRDNSEWW